MPATNVPLDTWLVAESVGKPQLKPLSTHATQEEAEAERDRRNAEVGARIYIACRVLEPAAARMGCAVKLER